MSERASNSRRSSPGISIALTRVSKKSISCWSITTSSKFHLKLNKSIGSQVDRDGIAQLAGPQGEQLLFDRDDHGKLRAWLLVARHHRRNGSKAQAIFGMDEESDGTRRLMHLAPVMMGLTTREFTCVIDELDRSLHPEILHSYLA